MEVVQHSGAAPKKLTRIDYKMLAKLYNNMAVGDCVEMEPVYNITLFKGYLEARKVHENVDFEAWTKDGKTFVKKLTQAHMMKV